MDTLINLNESTDHITISLNDKKHQIKIVGTYDDPYFCGKDVCAVLEHENIKATLHRRDQETTHSYMSKNQTSLTLSLSSIITNNFEAIDNWF